MNKSDLKMLINRVFLQPHFYIVVLFVFGVIFLFYEPVIGFIAMLLCVASSFFTFLWGKKRSQSKEGIQDKINDLQSIQKNILSYFPFPFIMVDVHGWIKWYNSKIEEVIKEKNIVNKNIHSLFSDITAEQFPKGKEQTIKTITVENRHYKVYIDRIYLSHANEKQRNMYGLYFIDNTNHIILKEENLKQKVSIGLIFIDNYEEVMQSVEDVRRPLLIALIDRKLNAWAQQGAGIVKKLEKDQYLALFNNEHLEEFRQKKFEILDEIRQIHIGNELPVTLSIGFGVNGKTLPQSMEYAKAAIDLALGRGGDQAVIKNVDKYLFYGGKTKEVEKSTRVKARMKAYAFREIIEESDEVLIMGHKNPDVDCFGAAIGVYRAAQLLGKKAYIVLNEPTSAIKTVYERILASGEYEEKIFLNSIEAIGHTGERTLVVVVDVHRPSYTECPELLELSKNIVVFDHHRKSAEFIENAVLTYLEPYISSTCEMIAEILQYIVDKVKLKPIEADILLAGITIDTKNFVFKTGVRTFEAAAFLRRNGADSTRVRMLFQNDMESYRARAAAVKDAQIYRNNMAISIAPSDIKNGAVIAAQAADELLNISGIIASFVMCSIQNDVMLSARSLGDINVQLIMEKLGGGGHQTVAGAQFSNTSIDEVYDKLIEAIDEYLEEGAERR
ncbi:MAG: phosphoesterase [Epulopiscium sp.]|nr:phosphoesterase [Candidatus Epulonipiscium sp.]